MEIKVSVENVDLSSVVGEHYVQTGEDDYGRVPQTLGEAIAVEVAKNLQKDDSYRELKKRITSARDEEIRKQVTPVVAAAIESSVQQTNVYGSPVGPPFSLTELIVKEAHAVLTKRGDYGRGPSYVEKIVVEMVDKAIKAELAAVIIDEKNKVVAAVRAKAADLIATAVKEGIGR